MDTAKPLLNLEALAPFITPEDGFYGHFGPLVASVIVDAFIAKVRDEEDKAERAVMRCGTGSTCTCADDRDVHVENANVYRNLLAALTRPVFYVRVP